MRFGEWLHSMLDLHICTGIGILDSYINNRLLVSLRGLIDDVFFEKLIFLFDIYSLINI